MVPPPGIEPGPLDFQSSVRTSYTKAACCNFTTFTNKSKGQKNKKPK